MRKHVDPPLHSCCMMLQSVYLCLRLAVPASLGEAGGHLPADKTNSDERWCKGGGGAAAIREWKEDATMKELHHFQEHAPSNDLMALLKLCPTL